MDTATATVKAGDVVIYVAAHGEKPVKVNVDKVTKAGWLKVNTPHRYSTTAPWTMGTFKPYGTGEWKTTEGRSVAGLYAYTDEKWAALEAAYAEETARLAAKKAEREEREAANAARKAAELAEVKEVVGTLATVVKYTEAKDDGCTLYLINVPAKPELRERRTWATVMVTLRPDKKLVWESGTEEPVLRCDYRHITSNGGGGAGSSETYPDKDTALWAVLTDLYHSW